MILNNSLRLSFFLFLLPTFSPVLPADIVAFPSGQLTLRGVLYKPGGRGPFPAILYNHGSAPGMLSNDAFEKIGPVFADRGWVFFAPYRRGQGLSASAGGYIGDEIATARRKAAEFTAIGFAGLLFLLLIVTHKQRRWIRGLWVVGVAIFAAIAIHLSSTRASAAAMVRLLETDHLNDQLAARDWLQKQDFVKTDRIAVAGNSFGGIEAVLGAERVKYCAAVDPSGGAESWSIAPEWQIRMTHAARNSQAPIFFFQAQNDYDLSPSRTLSAAMKDAGKTFEVRIYPAFGNSAPEGHSFAWLGISIWADDVFRFLEQHCGKEKS